MDKNTTTEPSAPTWNNWSGNIVHTPPFSGANYYFMPKNQEALKNVIEEAKKANVIIRVSGQRHSQPPLVIEDNRATPEKEPHEYLIDMSCYADLGDNKDQTMILGPGKNQVTVNTGVREDDLDAFLTANDLMFKTVTAGGFFSIGGMIAVDVHGATIDSSIFANGISEFNIMLSDQTIKTINADTPHFKSAAGTKEWDPLQFARVSLGGLGVITSVVLNVIPRPAANTLKGEIKRWSLFNRREFSSTFTKLLAEHDRIETFFTPYAASWKLDNFLTLAWNVVDNPKDPIPNKPSDPQTACQLAHNDPPEYGAPYLDGIAQFGAKLAEKSQYIKWADSPLAGPAVITALARDTVERDGKKANLAHSDLWLEGAVKVIFMSYFIPIDNLNEDGLGKVWDSLDLVTKLVLPNGNFHIAAPMEYRFVKGGNASLSGAYTEKEDSWFVNQDLIAFVKPDLMASQYPSQLLQFFADVERQWVAMGGFPHNGKMYGFYDPKEGENSFSKSGPFNKNFIAEIRERKGERIKAYSSYRKTLDPDGLFYNPYLKSLIEG
ncbi:MAG: D-arabinono-1,4-lactone oxidase [Saprospiraceae bacterium]|nr:D-arabinono-1,4-lactone oxidase [Saprospiraceae bacterium]